MPGIYSTYREALDAAKRENRKKQNKGKFIYSPSKTQGVWVLKYRVTAKHKKYINS